MALGIGMSINNARAVLEALFNQESGFVRTPKYGIEKKKTNSAPSSGAGRYKAIKSVTPVVEFLFGAFFLFVVLDALLIGNLISFIFLLPFPIGFFYTSVSSFALAWTAAAGDRQIE
jgi:hypothetical protein